MHEVLVNRLGGLSLPRKSVVRLTDRPDMTLDVYRGRKSTIQQQQQQRSLLCYFTFAELPMRSLHSCVRICVSVRIKWQCKATPVFCKTHTDISLFHTHTHTLSLILNADSSLTLFNHQPNNFLDGVPCLT